MNLNLIIIKNFLLLSIIFLSFNCVFGQDSIYLSPNGLNEVSFESKHNENTTYKKIISWINSIYKNPEKVIVGSVEPESITISGYSSNA